METKKRYQLPTKLYHVEDTLVSFGPLQLTLRQCFVLTGGGCVSLSIWRDLSGLTPSAIGLAVCCVPLILSVLIAGVRVADRYAEAWLLVLLEYLQCEKVYLWRPYQSKRRAYPDDEAIQRAYREKDKVYA